MATRQQQTAAILGSLAAVSVAFLCYSYLYYYRRRRSRLSSVLWIDDKPQRAFKVVLADNSPQPFVHLRRGDTSESTHLHPYQYEISNLLENIETAPVMISTESGPPPLTDSYSWIETRDQLIELAQNLSQENEFAVDTEQHNVRSFLGFTALLQVSTCKQDYLIDTIALHDDMHILRNIFADPNIRKVFHGADSDSLWLQRDFHIYIVNLFDTARACDILGKPQRSLAYLLQNYCGVSTNKIFQRADWRLRPLPEEMIEYARMDAHYLLYIADCLQNELLQGEKAMQDAQNGTSSVDGALFEECLRRSNMICLQLYDKDGNITSPAASAASLMSRNHGCFDEKLKEDEAFRQRLCALCQWRDAIARAEDESPRFLLSDRSIVALAENPQPSIESILTTVATAYEVQPIDNKYMTPFPSPSPVLIQNVRSLENLLQHMDVYNENDMQSFMTSYLGKSHNKRGIAAKIRSLFDRSKHVTSIKAVPMYEEARENQLEKRAERRTPRRWRTGDFQASRKRFVQKFSCKAPVYHNCRIYAGDGRLLCYCDRKKLDWYVQRGLAEFMDENPPAVKLLFEPKGRPEDENNDFYIQSKTNRCVGCGESNHYLRYRVIPSCYRQHFPEHLKSHRSHDIVLLCVDCHEVAHRAAEIHKKQVALDYGVPLFARRVIDSGMMGETEAEVVDGLKGGVSPLQLRTAAMALLRHGSLMPKERREQLEEVVQTYYGGRSITEDDIQAALLVGKGPREIRRLRKRKGLVFDKYFKDGDYDFRAGGNVVKLFQENLVEDKPIVKSGLGDVTGDGCNWNSLESTVNERKFAFRSEDVGMNKSTNMDLESSKVPVAHDETLLAADMDSVDLEELDKTKLVNLNMADGGKSVVTNLIVGNVVSIYRTTEGPDEDSIIDDALSQDFPQSSLVTSKPLQNGDSLEENVPSLRVRLEESFAANTSSEGHIEDILVENTSSEGHTEDILVENTSSQGHVDESLVDNTSSQGHPEDDLDILQIQESSMRSTEHRKALNRVSLLGHGPHGRKVVETLLNQEGEDGIMRFCQRWRSVFVEAVKPTHLPAGWDVSHSGRREFGDYSVYNPTKKEAKSMAG